MGKAYTYRYALKQENSFSSVFTIFCPEIFAGAKAVI